MPCDQDCRVLERSESIRGDKIRLATLGVLILTAFSGSAFLSFSVGPISLFPYRFLLLGLGVCVFAANVCSTSHVGRQSLEPPVLLSVGVMAYAALTLSWTLDFWMGVRHLFQLGVGLTALLIVYHLAQREAILRGVVFAWSLAVGAVLVFSFCEHLSGVHIAKSIFAGTQDLRFLHVPTATYVNPNDLAVLLALSFPFTASVFRYGRRHASILFGLLLSAGVLYIILATESRAALLALLCEGVVLVILSLRKGRAARRGWILLAALVVVAGIAGISPLVDMKADPNIVRPPSDGLDSIATRINLIRNGWEAIKASYGFGVGIGGWQQWFVTSAVFETEGVIAPHNWWLELATTLGLPFLFVYMALYLRVLWRSWKARLRARSVDERMLTEVALMGWVGFFFASLGPSSFLSFAPQWFFWGFGLAVLAWTGRTESTEALR